MESNVGKWTLVERQLFSNEATNRFKRKRYLRLRERGLKEGDLRPSSKSTKEGLLSLEEKCLVGGCVCDMTVKDCCSQDITLIAR